ncbi:hypothetical protein ACHAXH_002697, partial [Discostella pseudostelligera]
MDRPQYSDEQLRTALNNFYYSRVGGTAATADGASPSIDACCNHIYGYSNPNHELSMLQKITTTTILDYESKLLNQEVPPPSIDELLQQAKSFHNTHGPIVPFQQIIQDCSPSMALAAEFKRASPSKGDIASHPLDAGEQACLYYGAGACVISVLTEGRWFKGSLNDLRSARLQTTAAAANANVTSSLSRRRPAILRKDFIISPYQIAEAAANGADTILLIVATTPSHILRELITFARDTCNMEPLVEVHTIVELDVALEAGARVIGVNNRNLHSFQLDLGQTEKIAMELTKRGLSFHHDENSTSSVDGSHRISLCALSGMSSAQDVDRYRKVGVGMCLIGESLMRASDPSLAISGLCLDPKDYEGLHSSNAGGGGAYTGGTKIIKVCGITNPTDALVSCRAGANLIGVIFAEKSKRKVSIDQANEIVNAVRKFGERSNRVAIEVEEEANGPNTSALSTLISKARALEQASRVPLVVGVFQNQPLDAIRDIVEQCGLDMVQLHGSEGMAAANSKNFGVPALRVVDIELGSVVGGEGEKQMFSSSDKASAILDMVTSDPMAILLDTSIKGESSGGGTGMTFDWTISESLQNMGLPVIIAGGLTPENIASAVGNVRPWGVDVAGGVEVVASPGVKDHEKVEQFVGGAKSAAV